MADDDCGHLRPIPGCPSCDAAVEAMKAVQAATPQPKSGRRRVRTLAEARAAFPTADQVAPATVETLTDLKARYLTLQPEPRPEVKAYVEKYQSMFSPEGLTGATPEDLYGFVTSSVIANPGNLGTFYKGWNRNGPEATASSLRATIDYLLRGPGEDEDRLTVLIREGTLGIGIVLLTKVLCITQPERFLALLPYESANGKGKQDIGRVVFGLQMPDSDSTGMSRGRLAYWSNQLLRDALLALPGPGFVDLEHAKEFLWHAFCYLQGWASEFDKLPEVAPVKRDPADKAIDNFTTDLTAGQGYSTDPQLVEKVGMDLVTAYFKGQAHVDWVVAHVDREKCGWDITAETDGLRWCVEVKATSGPAPTVFVTANELDQAETNDEWVMAVVTNALTSPLLAWFTAADVVAAARPIVYRSRLNPAEGVPDLAGWLSP